MDGSLGSAIARYLDCFLLRSITALVLKALPVSFQVWRLYDDTSNSFQFIKEFQFTPRAANTIFQVKATTRIISTSWSFSFSGMHETPFKIHKT